MPVSSTTVPMIESYLAAKMQHQGFQRWRRIEFEAYVMQLFFGRHQFGTETAQIFHQYQRMLLLFEKPDGHESRKIAVIAVIAQEHFGRRQRRPLGDRIHAYGLRLLVRKSRRIELTPWNIGFHVPTDLLKGAKKFGVQHLLSFLHERSA